MREFLEMPIWLHGLLGLILLLLLGFVWVAFRRSKPVGIVLLVALIGFPAFSIYQEGQRAKARQTELALTATVNRIADEAEELRRKEASIKRLQELQTIVGDGKVIGTWFDEMEYGGGHLALIRDPGGDFRMLLQTHDGTEAFSRELKEDGARVYRVKGSTDFFVWATDSSLELKDPDGLIRRATFVETGEKK